jgi:hypothetical protein
LTGRGAATSRISHIAAGAGADSDHHDERHGRAFHISSYGLPVLTQQPVLPLAPRSTAG